MADRRLLGLVAGLVALLAAACIPTGGEQPPNGFLPPRVDGQAGHVTADALPTVQINGVVYAQTIIGHTVYAVGSFTSARPAGDPAGTGETPRSNILAYDLDTGDLITSFAPTLDRQALAITASPDGSRLYVGGEFTVVNGVNRYRIAALDPTTGSLVPGFNAIVDYRVNALVATDTTLYAGGAFNFAGPGAAVSRPKLAAFSTTDGSLLDWAPTADNSVEAMVMAPGGTKLVVGGVFGTVDGVTATGMAALDPTTGAVLPWPANTVVKDAGANAGILTLTTDGGTIFGGGYSHNAGGNLEGLFAIDPNRGQVTWLEDCHGDTYGAAVANGYVYKATHAHYCGPLDGFPQSDPWSINQRFALSYTADPRGVLGREAWEYYNFEGRPAPSLIHWFPDFEVGTYTGLDQAAWTVTANADYVVYGGEFLSVNNVPQQGLVRFAVPSIAPDHEGPRFGLSSFPLVGRSTAPGQVRISFPADIDRDDTVLDYRLTRDGQQVAATQAASTFWDRPIVGFTDTGLTPGQSYTYRVRATDPDGNAATSDPVTVTVATGGAPSPYADAVMADGALVHWRMGEPAGRATTRDELGFDDATVAAGATLGAPGAILGDDSTALALDGSATAGAYSTDYTWAYDTISVEAWVRTASTQGGRIVGFAKSTTGSSSTGDRVLYLTSDGRAVFGARPRVEGTGNNLATATRTVSSGPGLNDDQWHHLVGALGPGGMHLYVDGVRVASRGDTMGGQAFYGYWRVGADSLAGWPNRPASDSLAGEVDEVAVYHRVLTAPQVAHHYAASGRTPALSPAPADAYGAAVRSLDPYLDYRLSESSGTVAADAGIRANTGDYSGAVTLGQSSPVGDGRAARFAGTGVVAGRSSIYSPMPYSVEAWFATTTTTGGELVGFGTSRTGTSAQVDRQVYLRDDGRLAFRAAGAEVTSPGAYDDGAWHHVVATQGPEGMHLYVDGAAVGAGSQRLSSAVTGFWRIGGDATPPAASSGGFTGLLDEVAVYDRVLTADDAAHHFELGS